jgi:hypothetical protein
MSSSSAKTKEEPNIMKAKIKNKTKYEINSREIWTGYMNFLYKMTTFELEFLEDKLKTLFKDKHQELNLNEDNDESEQ